jgi:hypothetical protein
LTTPYTLAAVPPPMRSPPFLGAMAMGVGSCASDSHRRGARMDCTDRRTVVHYEFLRIEAEVLLTQDAQKAAATAEDDLISGGRSLRAPSKTRGAVVPLQRRPATRVDHSNARAAPAPVAPNRWRCNL